MQIRSLEAELSHGHKQKDRHDEASSRFPQQANEPTERALYRDKLKTVFSRSLETP
jgi:hypothetical protein